jgi:hypothetical protein
MILCAHSNAGFLNETTSRSHAGAHIFLSENEPFPRFNGAILSVAQTIKFVMVSAAKSKFAALFGMAREMIPHSKPSSLWGGPNQKALSKQITQPPQVSVHMNDLKAIGVVGVVVGVVGVYHKYSRID